MNNEVIFDIVKYMSLRKFKFNYAKSKLFGKLVQIYLNCSMYNSRTIYKFTFSGSYSIFLYKIFEVLNFKQVSGVSTKKMNHFRIHNAFI